MSYKSKVCLSMRRGCQEILAVVSLLLLSGCLASTPVEPIAIAPIEGGLRSLAMTRPTWDGTRPDEQCDPDIGDEIQWHFKRSLQKRGYQVIDFKVPPLKNLNSPDPVARWSGTELRQAAPESPDGIFRLRVTKHLDASLCDSGRDLKFLGMTAIAEIFERTSGLLIWQTQQECSDLSRSTNDVIFNCVSDLAQKVAVRLPLATHRAEERKP